MQDEPRRAEPGVHDGQLRRPRLVQADPPARRHARPDGESEGRDHRAPDQGQLHGGPVGARVLHLDPRRPQGPRRHRAPHGRLGLPDAAPRRRLAGRDRPRGRLRHRGLRRAADPHERGAEQVAARPHRRRRRAQAARDRASPARRRSPRPARSSRPRCSRSSRPSSAADGHGPGAVGAQVPRRGRRVPGLLRHLPGHRRDVRDRRCGRHRRRAVDRRAGHAADDADVPHRRRRRRRHHARPPARRRDLRGAEPEGCRDARRGRRPHRGRADRAGPEGDGPPDGARAGRRARRSGRVPAAAPHAPAGHERPGRRAGRRPQRGLAQPGRAARAQGLDADRAVPRRRGAEGLQVDRASRSTTSTSS